ncbi:hypothetical protein TCAL_08137 [Tigriopus californicus]|uniref:RNA polymerase III subunit Rpc25 domain-containing protein n=1 Tax=Tigriopus californicus TaxID=6832 RepID=A0A553PJK2_TIGCA|nr:DNA-directed RNA polymerase III subunit RPC8-like [Tigriopus californicus]TRY77865.1 hypothetical protein TCAL_08137 [Tigriopus californicus]|eukprot:TCALIF_08137-PA protein Name:"Similar to POLR3H DNA-directed RNA polymerase III subunit RPC8 (Homo sapiens)" AED:0.05 eAED:0.05 QI:296/1/1/1/0.5/0.66/3/133/210
MFLLSRLSSLVRLSPSQWKRPLPEALTDALNVQLANKVMHNVGLVLSVYDLLCVGDSYLLPMDWEGASHTRVTFRVIVFRPFVEEIAVGKIKSCTREGVLVSLGFFDDILIKPEALQHPKRFDETEQVWVWEYPTDEGHHDMFMDPGEEIRFRVTSEVFVDTSPTAPEAAPKEPPTSGSNADLAEVKRIPYLLHASVNEPGLGLISWWNS